MHYKDMSKALSLRYILALALLALLALAAQWVVQRAINEQRADAQVINTAGRQRMLSQKISKVIYQMRLNLPATSQEKLLTILEENFSRWTKKHHTLKNQTPDLFHKPWNDPQIDRLFQEIEPHYQGIASIGKQVSEQPWLLYQTEGTNLLIDLQAHESEFLVLMDQITNRYAQLSQEKLRRLKQLEWSLFALTCIVLLLEATLIFRPIIQQNRKHIKQISRANEALTISQDSLKGYILQLEEHKRQLQTQEDTTQLDATRLEVLVSNLHTGVLLENEHREVQVVNALFCQMFNLEIEPDKMRGQNCSQAAEWVQNQFEEPQAFVARIEELLKQREPVLGETLTRQDGQIWERDYVPVWNGETYLGHLWQYRDVTQQKQAEAKIQEKEKKYRTIIELANDAIFIANPDTGIILEANQKASQLTGWSREEIIGMHHAHLHPNKDRDKYIKSFQADVADQSGTRSLGEVVVQHKEGRIIPVEVSQSVIELEEGQKLIVGIFRDIAARKADEEKIKRQNEELKELYEEITGTNHHLQTTLHHLQESEEKYRLLAENTTDLVCLQQLDGTYTYVSPSVKKLVGYEPEELIGKSPHDFIHSEDLPHFEQVQEAQVAQNTPLVSQEFRFRKKDNSYLWFDSKSVLIEDENQTLVQIRSSSRDITGNKLAEIELARQKTLLEQIMDALPINIFIKDKTGQFLFVNKASAETLGRSKSEIIGYSNHQMLSKREARRLDRADSLARSGRLQGNWEEEITLNGKRHYFLTGKKPFEWESDHDDLILGYSLDITMRKHNNLQRKRQLRFTHFLNDISSRFIRAPFAQIDQIIADMLPFVTKFIKAQRGYMALLDQDQPILRLSHEWKARGVKPLTGNLEEIALDKIPGLLDRLLDGRAVQMTRSQLMEKAATYPPAFVEFIQEFGTASLIRIPLLVRDELLGYLAFDDIYEEKTWSEEALRYLNIVGQITAHALSQRKYEQKLEEGRDFIQKVTASIPDFVFVYDVVQEKYIYYNHLLDEVKWPHVQPQAMHSLEDIISTVHPDYLQTLKSLHQDLLKGNMNRYEIKLRIKGKQTYNRWVHLRVSAHKKDRQGKVLQTLGVVRDITREKQAEEQLISSNRLFEALLDNSPIGIHIFDKKGDSLRENQAYRDLLGVHRKPGQQNKFNALRHPVHKYYQLDVCYAKAYQGETVFLPNLCFDMSSEINQWSKHEGVRYFDEIVYPILNEEGEVETVVAFVQDVTERTLQAQRLKENQDFIQSINQTIPDDMFVYDLVENRFTFANKTVLESIGYSFQDLTEKGADFMIALVLPEDQERYLDFWEQIREGQEQQYEMIYKIYHRDTSTRWIYSRVVPFEIQHQQVMVIMQDITDLKQKEEELLSAKHRTEAIYQITSQPNFDLHQQMNQVLERAVELLGLETSILTCIEGEQSTVISAYDQHQQIQPEQTFHLKDLFCDITFREDRLVAIHHVEISDYRTHPCYQKFEVEAYAGIPIRVKGKKFGTLSLFSSQPREVPFTQSDKNFIYNLGQWISATLERLDYENELIEARQQAEKALEVKEAFLSTISHEIRTPMNAVIGMSHLLMQEDPKPEQLENLQTLRFSAENLLTLINDILDYSKIESGKIEFEYIDFNLREFINHLKQSFLFQAEEKGIELKISVDEDIPVYVRGDSARLNQVMTNLISNAVKFTQQGRVLVMITLLKENQDTLEIEFEVQDTGIGIAEDKQQMIFERFTQADASVNRQFGGTGLGLAITRNLLELQGSQISVESEVGKGARFCFVLTFQKTDQIQAKAQLGNQKTTFFQALGTFKLLLVEDRKVNQKITTRFLNQWGIQPDIAENGLIALEKAQQSTYDLILMDLLMPVMNGFEATEAIRALEPYQNRPIIALTASSLTEERKRAYEAGVNDFILKPFSPKELYKKISKALHLHPAHLSTPETTAPDQLDHQDKQLDFTRLDALTDGDEEMKYELIEVYIEELKKTRDEYQRALRESNFNLIKNIVHNAQASSSLFGTNQLLEELQLGKELMMQACPDTQIEASIQKIHGLTEQIILTLKQEMDT